jgi:pimeloyl-ACP methyl ester carboxylesterase
MSSREVTFDSGGCVIAGTYAAATNPVAAALLITGSGKTDRDSDVHLPLHQMLRGGITRQISDALAAAGVSTLRYDKRGVGASGGAYLAAGMDQRMTDAGAALGWLATAAAGLPLLAVGHSEGTYYAARLAADGRLAGAVLLSGSVRRGEDVLAWQSGQIATRLPRAARIIFRIFRIDPVKLARKNLERILASSDDVMRIQGTRINARWIRDFATYDPAPALARITIPVLAITGGQDVQVPPEDVEECGRLVRGPFDGLVVGDLSHLLRPDPGSIGPRGYKRAVREPVSREVLDLITSWVARHWARTTSRRPRLPGENR